MLDYYISLNSVEKKLVVSGVVDMCHLLLNMQTKFFYHQFDPNCSGKHSAEILFDPTFESWASAQYAQKNFEVAFKF